MNGIRDSSRKGCFWVGGLPLDLGMTTSMHKVGSGVWPQKKFRWLVVGVKLSSPPTSLNPATLTYVHTYNIHIHVSCLTVTLCELCTLLQ